jgi:hypothetical protein
MQLAKRFPLVPRLWLLKGLRLVPHSWLVQRSWR